MSEGLFPGDVLFFQRMLRAEGLYKHTLDGVWGPKTEAAAIQFEQRAEAIRVASRTFDIRSERSITTLSLKAQSLARHFLARVLDGGLRARIISGTRTYAAQDALFRQGRFGNPGPKITNARGGQSNHNFGIAWDIGIFTASGGYLDDGSDYQKAAALGLTATLNEVEWGGNRTGFVDRPHYQLNLGLSIDSLRDGFENGSLGNAYA